MDVLFIRHAIAEPRIDEGGVQPDDRLRALTGKGRRQMRRGAKGLRRVHPRIDVLVTSPLVRATQTAEIVSAAYGDIEVVTASQLEPGAGAEVVAAWLRDLEPAGNVAIVGHEPDLGELATWLLNAREDSIIELGKGGACLVGAPSGVPAGGATLEWLLTPRQLRRLGR